MVMAGLWETDKSLNSGFSLGELMTVIAVMAILTAFSLPNIISWRISRQIDAAAGDLQSTMVRARAGSVKRNVDVVVAFTAASGTYEAFVDNGQGGGTAGDKIRNGGERLVTSGQMPSGVQIYDVSFSGGAPWIRFNSRGFPNGLGGHVYIRNRQGRYRGIVVNTTGRCRIVNSRNGGATWN